MPEKKDDRRTAYSKKVIRDALFELLKEKPLNKITVTEICTLADVNRSTFYTYYEDIFDLHRKILRRYFQIQHDFTEFVKQYFEGTSSPTTLTKKDFYAIFLHFFNVAYENRDLFKFIYNQNSTNSVHISTGKVLYYTLSPLLYKEDTPKGQKAVFRKAYNFTLGGVTSMLIDWLKKDCPESTEEMARHTAAFCFAVFMSEVEQYNFERKSDR